MKIRKDRGMRKRVLNAQLLSFEIGELINRLKKQRQWRSGDRTAITLVKTQKLRVVLMALRKGAAMREHHVEGPITIYLIDGSIRFILGAVKCKMRSNGFLALERTIPHDLEALEDSVLLLTIVQL